MVEEATATGLVGVAMDLAVAGMGLAGAVTGAVEGAAAMGEAVVAGAVAEAAAVDWAAAEMDLVGMGQETSAVVVMVVAEEEATLVAAEEEVHIVKSSLQRAARLQIRSHHSGTPPQKMRPHIRYATKRNTELRSLPECHSEHLGQWVAHCLARFR
jgi:hypothetical protein